MFSIVHGKSVIRIAALTLCVLVQTCARYTNQAMPGILAFQNPTVAAATSLTLLAESRILQISLGSSHACVLDNRGLVYCWGLNADGQLGYGHNQNIGDDEIATSVTAVDVGETVRQISCGGSAGLGHTCALLQSGNIKCWGRGLSGRLGYSNSNSIGDNELPSSVGYVPLGGEVMQVMAGGSHSCALMVGGAVRCWGLGTNGRLGYGNTVSIGDNETPASVGDVNVGTTLSKISGAGNHVCGITSTDNVRCWGNGASGQLGYGNTNDIGDDELPNVAGDVPVGFSVAQISTNFSNTCALSFVGKVRCWGSGASGQLGYGNGTSIGDNEAAGAAGDLSLGGVATDVAVGRVASCALLSDGNVLCWGDGTGGRLGYANQNIIGDNELPVSSGPIQLSGPARLLAVGGTHACAVIGDNGVRCWGTATFGELGLGTTSTIGDDEHPSVSPILRFP